VRGVRVLFAEHLVEQGALVVVEQVRAVRVLEVQQPGQLEHVVAVAVLAGPVGQLARDDIAFVERLAVAVAADDVRVVVRDDLPEVHGDGAVAIGQALLPQP
jgi:hypothetical protein